MYHIINKKDSTIIQQKELQLEIIDDRIYYINNIPRAPRSITGNSLVDYIVDNNVSLVDIKENINLI